jgi:RHS repeat-associated protein
MMAAKERTGDVFPLAALRCLPETRVWVPAVENRGFIGPSGWLSSTTRWGCEYVYGGTASRSTDQRYHASSYGRFNAPDPYRASSKRKNPASWNRYTYVLSDPVNHRDHRGLAVDCTDDSCDESTTGGDGDGACDPNEEDCSGGDGSDSSEADADVGIPPVVNPTYPITNGALSDLNKPQCANLIAGATNVNGQALQNMLSKFP